MMGIGAPELVILLILATGVGLTILWVWMIVDCATHEPSGSTEKIAWMLLIIFTWIGGLIYLLVRRPKRIKLHGR